jgi:hypothetical protein
MAHSKSAISHYWVFVPTSSSKYWGRSGENVGLGYDIFRELSDRSPLWVTHASTLKAAKEKLEILVHTLPAEYFIHDATEAKIVARLGPNTAEEIKP